MRRVLYFFLGLLIGVVLVAAGFRVAAALRESDPLQVVLPAEGRIVQTDAGALHVIEMGPPDGPPLLFLHGTAAWSGLWQPVLGAMAAQGYRAIALDMPPFGFSERSPGDSHDRAAQAARILALLKALQVRPVLVAHSFGAGPGVEAVMQAPDAFAGLVVVDGALGIGGAAGSADLPLPLKNRFLREVIVANTVTNPFLTRRLLASFLHVKSAATEEVATVLRQPMTRQGSTAAFAAWLPSLLVPDRGAQSVRAASYGALCLPTVFLWGAEDTVTPLDQGREAAALVPGAALLVMSGVGHIPQLEAPDVFLTALGMALDRVEGRGPTC
ncbi:alpha/beta hydrolase [Paracoccus sp. M683]|nr:alpha/beta hydrolase [Paracoccus sp. M683]TRW95071.1 alpha/beta hydrolase [Paracoccus sp. M683]